MNDISKRLSDIFNISIFGPAADKLFDLAVCNIILETEAENLGLTNTARAFRNANKIIDRKEEAAIEQWEDRMFELPYIPEY